MDKQVWEEVPQNHAGYLYRLKVPGGWIVKETHDVSRQRPMSYNTDNGSRYTEWENVEGFEWRSTMCFVPDPEYKWLQPSESSVIYRIYKDDDETKSCTLLG